MAVDTELFDPDFLERMRTLFFKLRKRKQLSRRGAEAAPAAGFTREFKDHRNYTPGDDFRAIDWRLYARLEKPFIRIFEEVQEYHVHILIDRSQSMQEPWSDKRIVALRTGVALAYLALLNQHRVSILTLGDGLRRELQPMKGQGHVHDVLQLFKSLEFGGITDLVGSLKQFRPSRDRRGIVFLISDLFGETPELSNEALLQATRWPAETHIVHVLNDQERRPDMKGEIRLVDVETSEVRRIWMTRRETERYAKAFDEYQEELRKSCMTRQIDYFSWITEEPFEDSFINLLSRGSALAGK
jgi:uncharacterized protein (DUF58 family)